MKLISLELHDDFRSLKSGFRIDFLNEFDEVDIDKFNPYCIVGRNGSGKSNILEVLSSIFYYLEIEYLRFLPKQKILNRNDKVEYIEREAFSIETIEVTYPNAYILKYYIIVEGSRIQVDIQKEKDKKANIYIDENYDNPLNGIDEVNPYLPKHIIGYSSGENEILSLPFLRMRMIQHEEYIYYLQEEMNYSHAIESRMVYLDDTFSQAIFISNFIFPDKKIDRLFSQELGIKRIKEFRIIINKDKEFIDLLDSKYPLYSGVESKIEELKSCATLFYEDKENNQLILDFYIDNAFDKIFEKLKRLKWSKSSKAPTLKDFHYQYIEYYKKFNSTSKQSFTNLFKYKTSLEEKRLELFKLFQLFISLNYYRIKDEVIDKLYTTKSPYAKGFIPEPSWDDRFFTFKDFKIEKDKVDKPLLTRELSDGEYQFMHSIGLALIYKNTPSLFLLDEPETHLNPDWRAKYISTLRECFKDDEVFPEVLITSHSPFIVSDSKQENVLVFKKDDKGIVEARVPQFNTFGASVNKITRGVFDRKKTIGNYASEIIDEFKKEMETTDDMEGLFERLDETIGDSIEKTLFMKELFDRIEKR